MIKRILVALDPDSDTPIATRYASNVARRFDAEVVGLAVVDTGHIESGARGGGIGSMYYAEKLRENLSEETRGTAQELIRKFEAAMKDSGVSHSEVVEEGVPFQRILEDMKYHDLLVVGREPHFFYGHPEQKTKSLAHVVKLATAPTLVVGQAYMDVQRVMIAYDGSAAASRTIHYFVHLMPFGTGAHVDVVHIHEGDQKDSELMLHLMSNYLGKHGLATRATSLRGDGNAEQISELARDLDADIVVAGAHSGSKLKEWAFGSTTATLLKKCPKPMFLYH